MTPVRTNNHLRQTGIVRIEVVAIVMLLAALATVLIIDAPVNSSLKIQHAVAPAPDPVNAHSGGRTHRTPQPELQSVSVTKPDRR